MLESRVAKLEAHVEHMVIGITNLKADVRDHRNETRQDFRIVFGALIVTATGLAGMMAKGFGWL